MRTILKGGTVVQVGRRSETRADLVMEGTRIVDILRNATPGQNDNVIDVSNLMVCPGFIDTHVHAESVIWSEGCLKPALAQGVTTLLLGQDGCSWAPTEESAWDFFQDYFAAINGRMSGEARSLSVGELLDGFDHRAQNIAYLVPHGNLRRLVTSGSAPLTPSGIGLAMRHLADSLADGAIGMSSGLDYVPSRYGDVVEMAALCDLLRTEDKVYVSHLRATSSGIDRALGELMAVGAESGARVHASHLRGPWDEVKALLDKAEAQNIELSYDSYPYLASNSLLGMYLLPPEMQSSDLDQTLAELVRPDTIGKLSSLEAFNVGHLSRLTLSYVGNSAYRWMEGLSLVDAADESDVPPANLVVDLLYKSRLEVSVIYRGSIAKDVDIIQAALDGRHCGGSDGIYLGSKPHPRSYAAFTTLLKIYLESGAGWLGVAEHLATRPAEIFRMRQRGDIEVGYAADIAVFDESKIRSDATFENPKVLSEGLRYAWVNGELAWAYGAWTGSLSGRSLHA